MFITVKARRKIFAYQIVILLYILENDLALGTFMYITSFLFSVDNLPNNLFHCDLIWEGLSLSVIVIPMKELFYPEFGLVGSSS